MIRVILAFVAAAAVSLVLDALSDGLPIFDGFTIIQTKTMEIKR